MKVIGLPLLALAAAAVPALAAHSGGGERFAPVVIGTGQGVRANISNVSSPLPVSLDVAILPCPVDVSFFSGNGPQIGSTQSLSLVPGVSMSVPATSPSPGLVRAVVNIADTTKAQFCGLKTDLEVFDTASGATLYVVPSEACLGLGQCTTPLPKPGGGR